MNIYEFAMQKEEMSENYYRDLANKCESKGLQRIFTMLADEEHKHYQMVQEMEKKGKPEIGETSVLSDAKKVFERMRDEREQLGCEIEQLELYKDARKFEKESEDYYREKAEEVEDEFQQGFFKKMADEEHKHFMMVENIIQLVQRPERWLENAEWTHLEEY